MRNLFKVSYKFRAQRAGGTEEDGEGQRAVKLLKDAQIGPRLTGEGWSLHLDVV